MALTTSALQGYQTAQSTSVYSVLLGGKSASTTSLNSLLGGSQKDATKLTESQQQVITGLQDFVKQNLKGADAEKLNASIGKLETMMKNNNLSASYTDSISQLFSGNSSLARSLQSGGLINGLF